MELVIKPVNVGSGVACLPLPPAVCQKCNGTGRVVFRGYGGDSLDVPCPLCCQPLPQRFAGMGENLIAK